MARDISNIVLPPDVLDMIPAGKILTGRSLEDIAVPIRQKRDDAVAHRASQGVDDLFNYCEEAYIGMDDLNRSEFSQGKWIKPTTLNAPITTDASGRKNQNTKRSTAFVRLTSRYVDAGDAKVCEI